MMGVNIFRNSPDKLQNLHNTPGNGKLGDAPARCHLLQGKLPFTLEVTCNGVFKFLFSQ